LDPVVRGRVSLSRARYLGAPAAARASNAATSWKYAFASSRCGGFVYGSGTGLARRPAIASATSSGVCAGVPGAITGGVAAPSAFRAKSVVTTPGMTSETWIPGCVPERVYLRALRDVGDDGEGAIAARGRAAGRGDGGDRAAAVESSHGARARQARKAVR
jgi:hypothetical protein